jgi:hypothetical protein
MTASDQLLVAVASADTEGLTVREGVVLTGYRPNTVAVELKRLRDAGHIVAQRVCGSPGRPPFRYFYFDQEIVESLLNGRRRR